MPKYYCQNGDTQVIFDATNIQAAARKTLSYVISIEHGCALLTTVSEKGFYPDASQIISMIPFMKEANVDLPSDDILIREACKSVNIDPRILNGKAIDWLLYGEGEEKGENNEFG